MKYVSHLCLALLCWLQLSCKDSPEKLLDDARDVLEKVEGVLSDLDSGKITPDEAVKELEGVDEEVAQFKTRYRTFLKEGDLKEDDAEWEREAEKIERGFDRLADLVSRMQDKGKLTPDLAKILHKFIR